MRKNKTPVVYFLIFMIEKIRVSVGTLHLIGLRRIRNFNTKMEVAYLLTYVNSRCTQNCLFCAHARESKANLDRVARAYYPAYDFKTVYEHMRKAIEEGKIKRICLQTINHPKVFKEIDELLYELSKLNVPITLSRHPASYEELMKMKKYNIDRIVIPLDAASKRVFDEIKGEKVGNVYRWEKHWEGLRKAVKVFGRGNVGTHIIIGLGETEEEAVKTLYELYKMGVEVGLFAYVKIPGTKLSMNKPDIDSYRRIQLAHYLIRNGYDLNIFRFKNGKIVEFLLDKNYLRDIIMSGKPFLCTGCPNCNRPYSTESPSGPIYNYPETPPKEDLEKILKSILKFSSC